MFMLVMYISTDDNNKDQVKYMHQKETAWSTSIRVEGVQQKRIMEIPKINNLPKMKYYLSAMTLNNK